MNLELAKKTVVLTGTFSSMDRAEAKAKLVARGAKVTDAVSKNTDIIFAGADASGGKLLKAKSLGVKVLKEGKLVEALAGGAAKPAKAAKPSAKPAKTAKPSAADKKAIEALVAIASDTKRELTDEELASMFRGLATNNSNTRYHFAERVFPAVSTHRNVLLPHVDVLFDALANKLQRPGGIARLLAWLDGDYTLEQRRLLFTHEKTHGGRVLGKAGAVVVPELAKVWGSKVFEAAHGVIGAAIELREAAAPLAPLFEKALKQSPTDNPHEAQSYFNTSATTDYGAAVALVAIDPSRAMELIHHLQLALQCEIVTAPATTHVGTELRSPIRSVFERLPAAAQEKLAETLAVLAKKQVPQDIVLQLFLSLGEAGLERAAKLPKKVRATLATQAAAEALPAAVLRRLAS